MRKGVLFCLLLLFIGCIRSSPETRTRSGGASARVETVLSQDAFLSELVAEKCLTAQVDLLLREGRYDQLEALAEALQKEDASYDPFRKKIEVFYEALGKSKASEKLLRRWRRSSPDSRLPLLGLAEFHYARAEETDPYHYEVRQDISALMLKALKQLHLAADLEGTQDDPHFWVIYLKIAYMLDHPEPVLDRLLKEIVTRDPQRYTAYALRAERKLWSSDEQAPQAFHQFVEELAQQHGDELRAVCLWKAATHGAHFERKLLRSGLPWESYDKSFDALRAKFPEASICLDRHAFLAALFKSPRTPDLLKELGDDFDVMVWRGIENLESMYSRHAPGEKLEEKPFRPVKIGVEGNFPGRTPSFKLKHEVSELFSGARFGELEQLAQSYRGMANQERVPVKSLERFYEACKVSTSKRWNKPTDESTRMSRRWKTEYPDSQTVDVVLLRQTISTAWAVRGGGWASTVSPEAHELFQRHLRTADKIFQAGKPYRDAYAYSLGITALMGLSQSHQQVKDLVARAKEIDPTDLSSAAAEGIYLLPRWHGSPLELERWAEDLLANQGDPALFAILERDEYREALLSDLPRNLVERSLKAAAAAGVPPDRVRSYTLEACSYWGDRELGSETLSVLGSEIGHFVDTAMVESYRDWVEGKLKAPPIYARARVIISEEGLYESTLNGRHPLKKSIKFPYIGGCALGFKVTHQSYLPGPVWRKVTLWRPAFSDEKGEQKIEVREKVLADGIPVGYEDWILWPLDTTGSVNGKWTLEVSYQHESIAVRAFDLSGNEPARPGVEVIAKGAFEPDPYLPVLVPREGQPKTRFGTAFGAWVRYVGWPRSVEYRFEHPPYVNPQGRQVRVDGPFSASKSLMPAPFLAYVFEASAPHEMVPGRWKLKLDIEGRDRGALSIDVGSAP